MGEVVLRVNGKRFSGWKSVRVTRTIESLSGSFFLDVADMWVGRDERWPIFEEDECQILLDGDVVIDGFVDRRRISFSATSRSLTYEGRDKTGALVDCSAVLDAWTIRNSTVFDIVANVAARFGVPVFAVPPLDLIKAPSKFVVSPGELAFDVIERAARTAGLMLISDGEGGIELVRGDSTARATTALEEGKNVLGGDVGYDATRRFHTYIVTTQNAGKDTASGPATLARAEAIDELVRRTERALLIRPSSGTTADFARQRADWEARIRAAQAEAITLDVLGWRQPGGELWPLNALVRVKSPTLGVNGEMRISEVTHSISDGGEVSSIRVVRPDAFTPEPQIRPGPKRAGGRWKEIAGGV